MHWIMEYNSINHSRSETLSGTLACWVLALGVIGLNYLCTLCYLCKHALDCEIQFIKSFSKWNIVRDPGLYTCRCITCPCTSMYKYLCVLFMARYVSWFQISRLASLDQHCVQEILLSMLEEISPASHNVLITWVQKDLEPEWPLEVNTFTK